MTTFHSIKRANERTNLNVKSSERFIENAITRGKNAEAFAAKEREYLLQKESKQGCRTIVYNGYCFIINDSGNCVTMYSLPVWFGKTCYDGKQKIRNVKRYIRYNNIFEQEDNDFGYGKVS